MYGFPRALTEDELLQLEGASQQAKKTARAWQAALERPDLTSSPDKLLALKPLVRKGIPYDLRPDAWYVISGAHIRHKAAEVGYYKDMSKAVLPPDLSLAIEEDFCCPNFPFRSNPLYQSRYGVDALRRLVSAYCTHNMDGYFKGLYCVAAFVLLVMGTAKEEEAFWTLVCLLENRMFNYCNGQGSVGAKVELRVLQAQLPRKMPKVAAHLESLECGVGAIAGSWFSTLFCTVLPAETTARVWDALLLEGNKVAQRTALAIMRRFESTLCSSGNPVQLRKVLDSRASRMYDAEGLMALGFKGIGAMPGVHIGCLRVGALREVEQQARARQQAYALLLGMH